MMGKFTEAENALGEYYPQVRELDKTSSSSKSRQEEKEEERTSSKKERKTLGLLPRNQRRLRRVGREWTELTAKKWHGA